HSIQLFFVRWISAAHPPFTPLGGSAGYRHGIGLTATLHKALRQAQGERYVVDPVRGELVEPWPGSTFSALPQGANGLTCGGCGTRLAWTRLTWTPRWMRRPAGLSTLPILYTFSS